MIFDTLLQAELFLLLVVFVMVGIACLTLMERGVLDYTNYPSGPTHIHTRML
jgi:hypothetical protein